MKCTNCGFESELEYPVCPQCQAEIRPNPAAQKILSVLKDPLFFVICILMSVSTALSLMAGNLPLINILITVFLWLTYAQSCKGIADANHLRCVSGAVYANYVITYVSAGLVVVVGLIFTVAFGLILGQPGIFESLLSEFIDMDYAAFAQAFAIIPSGIILFIFIFAAAIIVVINIFSMRYIHRFVQSVYQSIGAGVLKLKHVPAAKICMFIFGGVTAFSCLANLASTDLQTLLISASGSAVYIIAGLLIRKHLSEEPAVPALEEGQ